MKRSGFGLALLVVIALLPGGVFCQSNPTASSGEATQKENDAAATTTVAGIVRTIRDIPVPGATVRIVHVESGRSWVSWTDEGGKFSFSGVPAGRYLLEAKQLNFGASQIEVYFPGETATEAQLTLRVEIPTAAVPATKAEAKAPPTPAAASVAAPEKAETAKPAEEAPPTAAKKTHRRHGFQQLEAKGQPGVPTSPTGNAASGSKSSKASTQDQPLSASGTVPDDSSSALGDASSSDALLMSGTVNRSATLGGSGSFGGVGGEAGSSASSASFDSAAAAGDFPLPGQGDSGASTGKGSGHSHRSLPGTHHKKKQTQALAPGEANSFGQGIEQLWAQHRLSRLSSDRAHFSFYNRYDNSVWDARPYSLTELNPAKIDHYDDKFGARVGGPLYIPHIYDGRQRTFFFVSYEVDRGVLPHDVFISVPTAAERTGDFTDRNVQLFDPTSSLTGPRIPLGSKIPQNRLDPAAVKMLQFFPLPNLPGFVQNFHFQRILPASSDLGNIKILHTISPKLNLLASYQGNSVRSIIPFTHPQLTNTSSTLGQVLTLDLTQNWTSRLINESKINWSRFTKDITNPFAFKENVAAELGITGVSQAPVDWGVPLLNFTNFNSLIDTVPMLQRNQTLRVLDNVAYMFSKHTIRTGAEIRWIQLNLDTNPIPRGGFDFTGVMTSNLGPCSPGSQSFCPVPGTGFDFADFLMGFPQSTTERFGSPATYLREREYVAYVQDDWRIHPRFAVDLGVRYELAMPPEELFNSLADLVMNPAITQVALICASPSFSTSCAPGRVNPFTGKALPRSLIYPDTNNWSPRIGIAWRPPSKLPLVFRAGYGIFYNESIYNQLAFSLANQAPYAESGFQQTTRQTVLTLENGFPEPPPTNVTNTVAVDPNYKVGYAQLWNVSLESQVKPSLAIEVTYTGTKGTHLDLLRAPNRATPGSPFNTDISRRIANAPGFTFETDGASSIYHAVQLLVQRRMSHGLMVQGTYTFARSIDNASAIGGGSTLAGLLGAITSAVTPVVVQNDNNFRAERALSTFDMRQQFRGQFSYELPFGQTKRWLHNGWASGVFSNLQASGITYIHTGMPFTALLAGNVADNSGTGAILSTRPDQISSANLPGGQRTPLHFFNTAAFTIPQPLQFGDASRGSITGPGNFYINFGLQKKFRFGEDGRVHLDARWEVQNLTNTPNFDGLETHLNSSSFGRVLAVKPMRTMDLMMRVSF